MYAILIKVVCSYHKMKSIISKLLTSNRFEYLNSIDTNSEFEYWQRYLPMGVTMLIWIKRSNRNSSRNGRSKHKVTIKNKI